MNTEKKSLLQGDSKPLTTFLIDIKYISATIICHDENIPHDPNHFYFSDCQNGLWSTCILTDLNNHGIQSLKNLRSTGKSEPIFLKPTLSGIKF